MLLKRATGALLPKVGCDPYRMSGAAQHRVAPVPSQPAAISIGGHRDRVIADAFRISPDADRGCRQSISHGFPQYRSPKRSADCASPMDLASQGAFMTHGTAVCLFLSTLLSLAFSSI